MILVSKYGRCKCTYKFIYAQSLHHKSSLYKEISAPSKISTKRRDIYTHLHYKGTIMGSTVQYLFYNLDVKILTFFLI